MEIIKNSYLFREEIIVKLSEFLNTLIVIPQMHESQIMHIQKVIRDIQFRQQKIEMLYPNMMKQQNNEYLYNINNEYMEYLQNKYKDSNQIFDKYYEKNLIQKQIYDTNKIVQIQQKHLQFIIKILNEFLQNIQIIEQKQTIQNQIFNNQFQVFQKFICTNHYFQYQNLKFIKKIYQKSKSQNITQKNHLIYPLTNNYEFYFNLIITRNKPIKDTIIKYQLQYQSRRKNRRKETKVIKRNNENTFKTQIKQEQNFSLLKNYTFNINQQKQQKTRQSCTHTKNNSQNIVLKDFIKHEIRNLFPYEQVTKKQNSPIKKMHRLTLSMTGKECFQRTKIKKCEQTKFYKNK